MKILIFGAGVIGVTYAWQLSEAGCDITLLARPDKAEQLKQNGIQIECLDTRGLKQTLTRTVYRPAIVSELRTEGRYDLIIVAVNSHQISEVLPVLKEKAGQTDILFFSNNWSGIEEIAQVLPPEQYFFGYPFKAGGGRDANGIQTVIFGTRFTDTVLGEKDGTVSARVKRIHQALKKARMNPVISKDIVGYLQAHYIWAAANVGAYMQAGSYQRFASDWRGMRALYLAMREGFEVCRARGVDPARIWPTSFYYLPLFLLVPFSRMLYRMPVMQRMFEGHVLHSPAEMHAMYYEVLQSGKQHHISMPVYESYQPAVEQFYEAAMRRAG